MHTRRRFLQDAALAAGLFALPGLAKAAQAAGKPRPNVLFIPVDDLKPLLGCYGAPGIRTPNIDALAARGMVFERAYCQQAVCSPSRTSLMTGRRPDSTRVYDLETHFRNTIPDVITLAQHFGANGYRTQAMGKIYHPGFDDAKSWTHGAWHPRGPEYRAKENTTEIAELRRQAVQSGKMTAQEANKKIRGYPWEAPEVADDELPDGRIASQAVQVLRELKGSDRPFFLATGFLKPHLPFVAPKKYYDLYPLESIKLAENPQPPTDAPPMAAHTWGELRAYRGVPAKGALADQQARELIRGYYAATSYLDAQVGRVLDELDRQGLRQNTIVVLWGDHGWHLGDHGLWCKHTNFESAVNAPLLVSAPGMKQPGSRSKALVEFVDIYPTLCDLAGLPLPQGLEGSSFTPLLDQPDRPWKKAAFSQYPRGNGIMGYSMVTDRYRYTEWRKRNAPKVPPAGVELYDHQADPQENVNLAGRTEYKELAGQLSQMLAKGWRGAVPEKL